MLPDKDQYKFIAAKEKGDRQISKASENNLPIHTVHFLCGSALSREPQDVVLAFPPATTMYFRNKTTGKLEERNTEASLAGMLGFDYGNGRVVIASDQGIFRHLIKSFDGAPLKVSMNHPENQNAALFVNTVRWLARLN